MCDEEDLLSSDSEDEDYVPTGLEEGSEEEESGEDEAAIFAEGQEESGDKSKGKSSKKKKKKGKPEAAARKRTGGIKLDNEETEEREASNTTEDNFGQQLAQEIAQEKEVKKEVEEKKKTDDLWASFMADVGTRPKPKPKPSSAGGLGSLTSSVKSSAEKKPSEVKAAAPVKPPSDSGAKSTNGKVTITKEFDFAGETVQITKQVDASSKEAQEEIKKKEEDSASASAAPGPSLKRPGGGLGSVLGKIGKKPKISVLEKSKLDWNQFKHKEGIDEELSTHNKGKEGYIERMKFLQRTDYRQFEQERDLRLKTSKS